MFKRREGVTLVTLTITIIALVILAGISIFMVVKPDWTEPNKKEEVQNNTQVVNMSTVENTVTPTPAPTPTPEPAPAENPTQETPATT